MKKKPSNLWAIKASLVVAGAGLLYHVLCQPLQADVIGLLSGAIASLSYILWTAARP